VKVWCEEPEVLDEEFPYDVLIRFSIVGRIGKREVYVNIFVVEETSIEISTSERGVAERISQHKGSKRRADIEKFVGDESGAVKWSHGETMLANRAEKDQDDHSFNIVEGILSRKYHPPPSPPFNKLSKVTNIPIPFLHYHSISPVTAAIRSRSSTSSSSIRPRICSNQTCTTYFEPRYESPTYIQVLKVMIVSRVHRILILGVISHSRSL